MEPSMKFNVITFLCLAALLGAASGLNVGPVRLVNNQTHIDYKVDPSADKSLIECPYHLDEGEVVSWVYWEMWDDVDVVGTYEWRPGSGGHATGRLDGVVKLNRDDGGLELTKLRYDLVGKYSCSVRLTNDEMKKSNKEEVLIIDINGYTKTAIYVNACTVNSSYTCAAVFPEPRVRAGLFSKKLNQYYEEVSHKDWLRQPHRNGSVTYSFSNVIFKVDRNTSEGIVFKIEMSVTKSDGKHIPLHSIIKPFTCIVHSGSDGNDGNKAVISSGIPSLALLSTSLLGVVFLLRITRL